MITLKKDLNDTRPDSYEGNCMGITGNKCSREHHLSVIYLMDIFQGKKREKESNDSLRNSQGVWGYAID